MKNELVIDGSTVEVESRNLDQIIPMHDQVLTELVRPMKTEGGLHVPEHYHDNNAQPRARVLALGPDCAKKLPDIKVGDIVIVDGSNGQGVNVRKYVAIFPAACVVAKVIPANGRDLMVLAS